MKSPKSFLLSIITFILIGCASQQMSTQQSIAILPTTAVTQTPEPLPTFGFFPTPTLTVLPTEVLLPTPNVTTKIPFTLDKLRMVIVKKGNLYIQNGINPLVQLTHSGQDRDPILSNDGRRIVFYRGENLDNVNSINSDGSQEQAIITSQSLPVLGRGDIRALTFVPNTHVILFNTYLCNPREHLYDAPDCKVGIYSVDIDSGKINELISGLSGNGTQTHNFEVSPDGKYISVAGSGHIDIYSLSTQSINIFQPNAILYNRTTPDEFLPVQYWFPDSSGLIVILPEDKSNEPATPPQTYTVWRYIIDANSAVQVSLGPPIAWSANCDFSVSPDGNWIFYINDDNGKQSELSSLYLGNLNNGHTQSYNWRGGCPSSHFAYPQWSPDSFYFGENKRIGSIDGAFPIDGDFMGWIDENHYFYITIKENKSKPYIGVIGGESIALPEEFQISSTYIILNK